LSAQKGEFRTANARHLRRSVGKEAALAKAAEPAMKPRKPTAGQKEMLMPIEGKKPKETETKKSAARPQRKSA
jgi:DNA end-binding protein Ku